MFDPDVLPPESLGMDKEIHWLTKKEKALQEPSFFFGHKIADYISKVENQALCYFLCEFLYYIKVSGV